ncbi:MAG: glucose-6-phosphate dehydrogenase [Candidatus Schekmanbacteria bacterium]|nr:glucose-6-phosphate dehydrogenase [Candidatus Schekmanbacteria bacterium]
MEDIASNPFLRGGFCVETRPAPCSLIIFGVSGDLSNRMLIPALFNLFHKALLPDSFFILGCGRSQLSDDSFRQKVRESCQKNSLPNSKLPQLEEFLKICFYNRLDYATPGDYQALQERLKQMDQQYPGVCDRIFYLATPPGLYPKIVTQLGQSGLTKEAQDRPSSSRVVVEKPFGHDLQSAVELNNELLRYLHEHQIFRIDHYLGKETVQNILMLRFANAIFEPLWNRRYIDHIQITAAETLGVEHRAGYFEQAGLLRDMFLNHLLELLAVVAMEPPISFDANRIRDEKAKLLRSLRPFSAKEIGKNIVRGQYRAGQINKVDYIGYREETGVARDSLVETFIAAKLYIDNWRWQGVPFYLRSGKRLARQTTEIAIVFRPVPHSIFAPLSPGDLAPNVLFLNIQPKEGISLMIQAKKPGPKICLTPLALEFSYREIFGNEPPNAYERLLLDCMLGDHTLFWRRDGMETAWSLFTPVMEAWEKNPAQYQPALYPAGSWGTAEAENLIQADGRYWLV